MVERQRSSNASDGRRDVYDEISEYEKLMPVDKFALDEQLEQQPDLFYKVSKAFALALSRTDVAKAYVDELEASLDAEVRRDMEIASEKVTEAAVRQGIKNHKDMRAAISAYLEKKEIANRLGALKDGFAQRSYAMKELVSLYAAGYFSDATGRRASRDMSDVTNRQSAEARTRALAERDRNSDDSNGRDRRPRDR